MLATSHIGGHKFAGNVIAYGAMHPCDGDWFGGVNAGNAGAFLDALLAVEVRQAFCWKCIFRKLVAKSRRVARVEPAGKHTPHR